MAAAMPTDVGMEEARQPIGPVTFPLLELLPADNDRPRPANYERISDDSDVPSLEGDDAVPPEALPEALSTFCQHLVISLDWRFEPIYHAANDLVEVCNAISTHLTNSHPLGGPSVLPDVRAFEAALQELQGNVSSALTRLAALEGQIGELPAATATLLQHSNTINDIRQALVDATNHRRRLGQQLDDLRRDKGGRTVTWSEPERITPLPTFITINPLPIFSRPTSTTVPEPLDPNAPVEEILSWMFQAEGAVPAFYSVDSWLRLILTLLPPAVSLQLEIPVNPTPHKIWLAALAVFPVISTRPSPITVNHLAKWLTDEVDCGISKHYHAHISKDVAPTIASLKRLANHFFLLDYVWILLQSAPAQCFTILLPERRHIAELLLPCLHPMEADLPAALDRRLRKDPTAAESFVPDRLSILEDIVKGNRMRLVHHVANAIFIPPIFFTTRGGHYRVPRPGQPATSEPTPPCFICMEDKSHEPDSHPTDFCPRILGVFDTREPGANPGPCVDSAFLTRYIRDVLLLHPPRASSSYDKRPRQ